MEYDARDSTEGYYLNGRKSSRQKPLLPHVLGYNLKGWHFSRQNQLLLNALHFSLRVQPIADLRGRTPTSLMTLQCSLIKFPRSRREKFRENPTVQSREGGNSRKNPDKYTNKSRGRIRHTREWALLNSRKRENADSRRRRER